MNMMFMDLIAVLVSFLLTVAFGKVVIPWLVKLKFGQSILEIGPNWHKNKQGTPTMGGIAEAVMKMSFGNRIGFKSNGAIGALWHYSFYGFIVAELTEEVDILGFVKIGETTAEEVIDLAGDKATIDELLALTGEKAGDAVVSEIFSRFCVGK